MSLNFLLRTLENNPTEQDLREVLPEIIERLQELRNPCQCCSRQGKYGCQGGCSCSVLAPDICKNCHHFLKEHSEDKCTGKWSGVQTSTCPCRKFMKSLSLGDR